MRSYTDPQAEMTSRTGGNLQTKTSTLTLRQARTHLMEYGDCPVDILDSRVAQSWRRSLAAGLLPGGSAITGEHADADTLRQSLARNHDLLSHSQPVMEYLFDQVRHSQNVVVLADHHGTLIHSLGDACFLAKAERVALSCGASWSEEHRGTNAIGTALTERKGVEIHGSEHFLERNGFLTCAAAPIMSATAELLGILDISGDQRSGHPHTLGLVNTAARMIENHLLIAGAGRHARLHIHPHPFGIGTMAEGILTLSDDGWIVGANRMALTLLKLTAGDIGSTVLERIIQERFQDILSFQRRRSHLASQVHLQDGSVLFVQIHADFSTIPAKSPSPQLKEYSVQSDALSRLDSGDLRWRQATDKARRILDKPISLLIQGESGVGKELFARAWHDSSARSKGPFVAINCAALPESLIESELFGYAPGSFTGAKREGNLGRLRQAHGGTLFLDEIGEMTVTMQTRLLRVLQERSVTPVGSGEVIDVDFALVCATHCKLSEAIERDAFRSDLFYRINGLTVQLPALRERTDFEQLTENMIGHIDSERTIEVAPDLLKALGTYHWPGNMRQYANMLRTACAMLEPNEVVIGWQHIPDDMSLALLRTRQKERPVARHIHGQDSQNLHEMSLHAIKMAIENSQGNISKAARILGISRQTLYRKIQAN